MHPRRRQVFFRLVTSVKKSIQLALEFVLFLLVLDCEIQLLRVAIGHFLVGICVTVLVRVYILVAYAQIDKAVIKLKTLQEEEAKPKEYNLKTAKVKQCVQFIS